MNKIKVFEAFAGYGSQSIALRNIGVPHEVVAISEIDKYAIQAYEAIHGPVLNLGDISKIKVEDIPQHDLFTYSFPCQDLSVAGKQAGLGKGTRSGLLYECEKIIEHCRPKYLLMENVKNLVGKKFKPQFDEWLKYLEGLGYTNYWKVLNAKDYGVPQNRERVFVVSILGEHTPYEFPKPIPLDKCIADILEDQVNEKYYINKPFHLVNKGHQAELDIKGQDCIKRVYDIDKIAPTLTTMQGGLREPKILEHKLYQNVKVRKYDVDINELKKILKAAKNKSGLTIKDIAYKLDKNKTTVEHWFRDDDCFSIPDEYIWLDLKKLLGITTDEFDKPIMEFEIKPNEYDMSNRAYHENGIAPTLTASGESGAKKILVSQSKQGYIDYNGKMVNLPCIAASRGRNPDNPSDRTAGAPTEQRLEINTKGTSNTITTVQKDNYVIEKPSILRYERTDYGKLIRKQYENGEIKEKIGNMRELKPRQDGISNTITTVRKDNYLLEPNYRIRKLTPRECFRLMGMREDDIDKIQQAGISNTQQYKMAGNSIVVNVLEAIFKNLFKEM